MLIGDILDPLFIESAIEEADMVFNFAGIADLADANKLPVDTAKVNILGNTYILEACRKFHIKRYIFASSLYVYGKHGGLYRCSKQACELFIEEYHEQFALDYTILRYGSVYGPRADMRNGIYKFVHDAMTVGKICYYGVPNALREYIHVEDAARCTVEVLAPEYANENIVLTGSQPMRVHDLFGMIAEILGKKIDIQYENTPENTHYEITPYSFMPKVGKKMSPKLATDLGQGILRVMDEIYHGISKK